VVSKYFKQNKPAVAPKSQFGNVENSDVLATVCFNTRTYKIIF